MPHLIVEYSDNLERSVDMAQVIAAVHEAALATGIAALDALRTRAEPRSLFRIADGHPENAFLGIIARMAPGRSPEEKQRLLEALLAAAENSLGAAAANTMLSVEYQEIDVRFRINKNNIRDAVAARNPK
jgi:5-carboxymethyl-2-hydroxymuconate isomerase